MDSSNPTVTLQQMASGYRLSRCLQVVTALKIADVLDDTPRTAAEIASAVGADPDVLTGILRVLSSHGVFVSLGETFQHSPSSLLLRSNHPQSMYAFVQSISSPLNWAVYESLEYAVRTGRPAAEQVIPDGLWAYFQEHREEAHLFNAAMAAKARGQIAGVLMAYDFSSFERIGDIGGGRGHLLRAVLDATPAASGILFDLPHVIGEVGDLASERLSLQAGDFFHDVLPTCDVYLLMDVIHNWSEEEAVTILSALRRAASPHAKVLLIETIVPTDPGPHWAKMVDLHMRVLLGGRQRTQQEYEMLFERGGFLFQRAIETDADITILEAIAV